jgi:hypothetical protein
MALPYFTEDMPKVGDIVQIHYSPGPGLLVLVLETEVLERLTTKQAQVLRTFALPLNKFLVNVNGDWALKEQINEKDMRTLDVIDIFVLP